jgi:hypothetical protein
MKKFVLALFLCFEVCSLASQEPATAGWMRTEQNDPLHKLDYSQVFLRGK